MKKYFFSFLALTFLIIFNINTVAAQYDVTTVIQELINWKKLDNGSVTDGFLINNTFLEAAGTTPGDWFPIGLGRYGYKDDYDAYLAVINEVVARRYNKSEKLSSSKATEWHRISLAVLAMGGDPANLGGINLIADGTYNRGKTVSLGKQGINGWIWGLISLDSMRYPVPEGAYNSRSDIIVEILRQQLTDGGFALTGSNSDPDISAMALQALAPYYNDEMSYTYTNKKLNKEVTKTVQMVVLEALAALSAMQSSDGDYFSWGTQNVESTVQVLTAICSLGIDPDTDKRFIKNGKTLLDGIMKYKMPDGGFIHSHTYDQNNPTSSPDKSNTMASEQALYGLVSYHRFKNEMRNLYDFRAEMNLSLKEQINAVKKKIDGISSSTKKSDLEAILAEYKAVPDNEQYYVYNYPKLSNALKLSNNHVVATPKASTAKPQTSKTTAKLDADKNFDTGEEKSAYKVTEDEKKEEIVEEVVKSIFSEEDFKMFETLPPVLTTENFVTVLKLIYKAEQTEGFAGKEEIKALLYQKKQIINDIQNEIIDINKTVMETLYPFDKISVLNKSEVDLIVKRVNSLSDYDRKKILRYEDIVKTKTQVDNLLRAIIISIVVFIIAAIMAGYIIFRIRKHRRNRQFENMQAEQKEYEGL